MQQTGPNTALLLIVGFILVILLLIFIFWLLNRPRREPDDVQDKKLTVAKERTAADDLSRIEGIGPKVASVLNDAGIRTFEQQARANSAEIKKVLNEVGLQMMRPEGWIEQAELAAKGDWDAL